MLDEKSEQFAKEMFGRYYSKVDLVIKDVEKKEFGFGNFEKKIMYRHMAFGGDKDFNLYVRRTIPPFISYSPSLYEIPDARPMPKKIWIGSELIFDIDATDLDLECRATHPGSWVCQNCQEQVKRETIKLIEEFLIPDFGFSKNEIKINFSGNRGYHVHVDSDKVFALDSKSRREISEYISGSNISIDILFPTIGKRGTRLEGPKPSDYGWGGRIAGGMVSALNKGTEKLIDLGMTKAEAALLGRNRANVIMGITTGNWDKVRINKKEIFWKNVIDKMTIKQGDSIDGNVTSSIYHLIRMPKTLHGDTALISREISSISRLEEFDPMKHSIVFRRGEVRIRMIRDIPELMMNDQSFGPYKNEEKKTVPAYLALYLILKRYATIYLGE